MTARHGSFVFVLCAGFIGLATAPGCVRLHGPTDVRRDLGQTAGVQLEQEFGLTVTRSGMWLARKATKQADEPEISLKGIRRVEIGVYQVTGLRNEGQERSGLGGEQFPGWTPLVRVHEDDEDVMILTQERDGKIRRLLIVAAESDEWVLIRIRGKLDQIIEEAIEMAFDEVDRPDLYAKTRRERGLESPLEES
jgi:hypothetical protein